MRIAKPKSAITQEQEKRFYELWRKWLEATDREDWVNGDYIAEYDKLLSVTFDVWWERNKRRVANIGYSEYAFIPIKGVDDFNEYSDTEEVSEHIFMIGFSTPKHILHAELDKLIDQFHKNHKAGHDSLFLGGIRSMFWNRKPTKRTVDTVQLIFDVYMKYLSMKQENEHVSLYEIGKALKLRNKFSDKVRADNQLLYEHTEQELMASTVSRYLKWAHEIRGQLCGGEFPYFNGK